MLKYSWFKMSIIDQGIMYMWKLNCYVYTLHAIIKIMLMSMHASTPLDQYCNLYAACYISCSAVMYRNNLPNYGHVLITIDTYTPQ